MITAPPEWWAAFDKAAAEAGMNLSTWLADAGKRRLPPEIRAKLPPPTKRGRPKKKGD
jgi:hypothetical protein